MGADMKARNEALVKLAIKQQMRGIRIEEPVFMEYRWYEKNRRRDLDNISSFGRKGNEDLQGKITQYEQQNAQLQAELQETKLKSAIKVALMSEKAIDVDYLTFKLNEKLKEKGETLELDENDNIKGWSDKLSGLKTQFPTMFESTSKDGGGYTRMDDGKLPGGDDHNTLTRSEILKKPYAERAKLFEENPEAYNAAMNSK